MKPVPNALVATATVYLTRSGTPGTADAHDLAVEVRGMTALEYFEQMEYLASLQVPVRSEPPTDAEILALQKYNYLTARHLVAVVVRQPDESLDEAILRVTHAFPAGAHMVQLEQAILELSGFKMAPVDAAGEAEPATGTDAPNP